MCIFVIANDNNIITRYNMVHVHTKIYAIKASAKGWSEFQYFLFNLEKAQKLLNELQKEKEK